MSRYKKIENVSDNTDTFFNVNMEVDDNISFNSTFEIKNKTVKANINKSLNKYDFYETLLDEFLKEYNYRISANALKRFSKQSKLDERQCKKYIKDKYTYLIKYYIDEEYITFDMAIKLAKNNLMKAIPSKYTKTDFVCDYNDEEEVLSLKNKYRKVILKDEIRYNKEEKRCLEYERDRINKLLEDKLKEMAILSQYKNKINNEYKKVK